MCKFVWMVMILVPLCQSFSPSLVSRSIVRGFKDVSKKARQAQVTIDGVQQQRQQQADLSLLNEFRGYTRLKATGVGAPSGPPEASRAAKNDRPFTLPPGEFRPKQSLGQNFLSDQNYVLKITDALQDSSQEGVQVVELGPGPGALSRVLHRRFPRMTAVEIDQRAVAFLAEKVEGLHVLHMDVLTCNWPAMAEERGGALSVIGNLPFYITSQILFSLADSYKAVNQAVVTMQLEVGERVVAKPRTKAYGILSVVFQLYGTPRLNFKIPASVFFPKPKIDACLVTIDFTKPHPELNHVDHDMLRLVVVTAFRKRRKMMRQSLKDLLLQHGVQLPDEYQTRRPEELAPQDFIVLTQAMFGRLDEPVSELGFGSKAIWRKQSGDKYHEISG